VTLGIKVIGYDKFLWNSLHSYNEHILRKYELSRLYETLSYAFIYRDLY